MFKVKVRSNIRADVVNRLRRTVDSQFVQQVQQEVIEEAIKPMIAAGVSPVQSVDGGRRFKGYKNPDKYPADKKAKRPVSLKLSGEMLAWYKAIFVSGVRITLGIAPSAPKEVKERAEANNVGTTNKEGQIAIAARRFVPLKGETYAVSVVRKIKNLYSQRIKSLLLKR